VNGFTLAGHISVDRIITSDYERVQLGGPPCFASALAKTMGFPVDIVTKIGADFPDELTPMLKSLGLDSKLRSTYPSTRFIIDYRHEPRRMILPTVCEHIAASELSDADRLLLCPITSEINDKLIEEIHPAFLALDPQGMLRKTNENHLVSPKRWRNPDSLKKVDILKTSISEHHLITGTTDIKKSLSKLINLGVSISVITTGVKGSFVMTCSEYFHVPAYPVEVIDPTGAGNVFLAGLASHIDEELEWACSISSASSSAIVETHGPIINCGREEIIRRTQYIQENLVKLG
jgi:sugar/nucleoside kinase (ribokinase family)